MSHICSCIIEPAIESVTPPGVTGTDGTGSANNSGSGPALVASRPWVRDEHLQFVRLRGRCYREVGGAPAANVEMVFIVWLRLCFGTAFTAVDDR